jgi:heparosan-N-sulfate-glucuronate 5-epimerase
MRVQGRYRGFRPILPPMARPPEPPHLCRSALTDRLGAHACICPPEYCLGGPCDACFGPKSAALAPGRRVAVDRVSGYHIDLRVRARFAGRLPPWVEPGNWHVATCQAGLASYERYLDGDGAEWLEGALAVGRWLVDQQVRTGSQVGGWRHLETYAHTFDLRPPWLSGMSQGQGASLLVRCHLETGDEEFAEAARRALRPLATATLQGGVEALLGGRPFPEEYPTIPPSFVLNGAFFALWGYHDVGLGLGDEGAAQAFAEGAETLALNLHRWDTGRWSRYDLYPHPVANIASPAYHRLHINLLRAMERVAPRREFAETLARFEHYALSEVNRSRAFVDKAVFRIVVPRNRFLALRLPWAR